VYLYLDDIFALFRNCQIKPTGAVQKFKSAIAKRTPIEMIFTAGESNQTAITRERLDRFRCDFLRCNAKEYSSE
jgi:hypothetical protein